MNWASLVSALSAGTAKPSRPPAALGQTVPGSCSDAVLSALREHAGRELRLRKICDLTGRPAQRVSWSLCFLKRRGMIRSREVSRGIHARWAPAPQAHSRFSIDLPDELHESPLSLSRADVSAYHP